MTNGTRRRAIRTYFLEAPARAETNRPNPLFGGRDDAIEPILRDVGRLARSPGPLANLSTVIHGAPGSGKSELLEQLRAHAGEMNMDPPVAVVRGDAGTLTDAAAFGAAVCEALGERARKRLRDTFELEGGDIALGPLGLTVGRKDAPSPRSERALMREVAGGLNAAANHPTIILAVDEAQGELRDALKARESLVLSLHKGETGLKVLPIYAGLGNTADELQECGVSRLGDGKRRLMRRLPDSDVAAMADEALEALTGLEGLAAVRWVDEIVEYAQGWPMHLSHALRSVAERAAPDWSLDGGGFRDAMRDAGRKRVRYYGDRLRRAEPELRPPMYAAWAGLFGNGNAAYAEDIAAALGLSDDDAYELAGKAVAAGLLERTGMGEYISPIPSLADHIERRGARYARRRMATMEPSRLDETQAGPKEPPQ